MKNKATSRNTVLTDSQRGQTSSYNPGHNVLAHFNNLPQVQIATSKTIIDI